MADEYSASVRASPADFVQKRPPARGTGREEAELETHADFADRLFEAARMKVQIVFQKPKTMTLRHNFRQTSP